MTWQPPQPIPTVRRIVTRVNETVAGLNEQKLRLAVAVRRHMVAAANDRDYRLPNLLVLGPTGGGKTWLVRAVMEAADVPYIEVNATSYSEVGYAGLDLAQAFTGFWSKRWLGDDGRRRDIIPLAERWGVCVIDEFDKWAFQPNLRERQPQRVLQAELLRFAEGDEVRVRERDSEMGTAFRTHHVLFIGMGAFQSLGSLVDPQDPASYRRATTAHIVRYGFLEELAGRFSGIVALPPLDGATLSRVLIEQIWPHYLQQAQDEGIALEASEAALLTIAQICAQERTGARALGPLLEQMLWKPWAEARPGDRICLRPEHVPAGAVLEPAA